MFTIDHILISESLSPLTGVVIDKDGIYSNRSLYSLKIKTQDIGYKYLIALNNSTLMQFYYATKVLIDTNIFPKIRMAQVRQLPIKMLPLSEQEQFTLIVDQILASKKETNSESGTSVLEAEIDQLVYELYGLTEDEIRLIEESVGS